MIDLSIVMTAHYEGRLAHHTMKSLFRAMAHAAEADISVEAVIVKDRADKATAEYLSVYASNPSISLCDVDYGDPGLARNFGVTKARGEFVAIIDSDDLVCQNWLADAYRLASQNESDIVAHVDYVYMFKGDQCYALYRQIPMGDPAFDPLYLFDCCYWNAICVARKSVFVAVPYQSSLQSGGFGYEDWHWNCETLSYGIEHFTVPNTVLFKRLKPSGSVFNHSEGSRHVVRPSRLFEPQLMQRLINKYGRPGRREI